MSKKASLSPAISVNPIPQISLLLLFNSIVYMFAEEGRKHGALRPQKPLRFIWDGEVGGSGIFISNIHSLHCHHQNDSALKVGSCVSHFNFSLIVWAKSQDSVHKPQFLKRKESRSGLNRGLSAY